MSLERLIAEHDHIEALGAQLDIAAASTVADPAGISAIVAELAIAIAEHGSNEQRSIYLRLRNGRDAAASHIVTVFAEEFGPFEQDFAVYLTDWTPDCIAADWETFRAETAAIVRRLRDRIHRENAIIYPLALQRGAIRLRAA